jgi:hypothetical protein
MEDLLRRKGLYRNTLGKEQEPTDDNKYAKSISRNDKDYGLIRMSISHYLRFHLEEINALNKAW